VNDELSTNGDDFSYAFQPIINTETGTVYSHEALIRGLNNESAYEVLGRHTNGDIDKFDARCRARAIEVASRIGLETYLNLNILPSAAISAEYGLDSTINAANRHSFPVRRIIIELTEVHAIADPARFASIINEYRRAGIQLAIDDFGAGYAGLSLLSEFQPDIVKLDMGLVRGIERDGPRQSIVHAIWQVCIDLGIDFLVEGVETLDEFSWFTNLGAYLYQGYLIAKPMFEGMPAVQIPTLSTDKFDISNSKSIASAEEIPARLR
jgi:blue light- and temperature-responsive anti-repressor